jgi:Double-GTPase 2
MADILNKVINAEDSETTIPNEVENPVGVVEGEIIAKAKVSKVYSGDAISNDVINNILAQDLVRFIVLAGLPSYGKTTLLASIFENLLYNGQYCNYNFAGSDTLIAFDKRCYLSRLSNSKSPDTKHTVLGEDFYLDLSLVNEMHRKKERLIIVDTSGETFQKFQFDNQAVKDFSPLRRADHFTYIIDASLLQDKALKHDVKDAALTILRSISECDMFPPNIKIQIVFSKWDLVNNDDAVVEFKGRILKDIRIICKGFNVKDFIVNSRDLNNPLESGKLFVDWLNDDIVYDYQNKIENNIIDWKNDHLKYLDYDRENK